MTNLLLGLFAGVVLTGALSVENAERAEQQHERVAGFCACVAITDTDVEWCEAFVPAERIEAARNESCPVEVPNER